MPALGMTGISVTGRTSTIFVTPLVPVMLVLPGVGCASGCCGCSGACLMVRVGIVLGGVEIFGPLEDLVITIGCSKGVVVLRGLCADTSATPDTARPTTKITLSLAAFFSNEFINLFYLFIKS